MALYYYMYRSWQDCCRRGENRSWPSVSVESVYSEYWCLNNAIVYAFIMRLTVEERALRSTFKLSTLYIHYVCVSVKWVFVRIAKSSLRLLNAVDNIVRKILQIGIILGAKAQLRKCTKSFFVSVCPSVHLSVLPHGTFRFPQNGFSWNFVYLFCQ